MLTNDFRVRKQLLQKLQNHEQPKIIIISAFFVPLIGKITHLRLFFDPRHFRRFYLKVWLTFWPRGFADAVLGTAYLLLLLFLLLFLENFFEFHEKSGHSLHCQQVFPENSGNHCSVSTKRVESNLMLVQEIRGNYCMQLVHENSGIQCLDEIRGIHSMYTKLLDFFICVFCMYCIALVSYQICRLNY